MKRLPYHLFVPSGEGCLYDTRAVGWSGRAPVRPVYERHYPAINDTHELRASLRAGEWVWPGGYPMYFVTADGAALSFDGVRENYRLISQSIRDGSIGDGWHVVGCEVNWEDDDLYCDHSGNRIPCAYPPDIEDDAEYQRLEMDDSPYYDGMA